MPLRRYVFRSAVPQVHTINRTFRKYDEGLKFCTFAILGENAIRKSVLVFSSLLKHLSAAWIVIGMNQFIGMRPSRFLLAIATLGLTLFFTFAVTPAMAKKKGGGGDGAPPPDDTRILVESVSLEKGTVVIENMQTKGSQTYALNSATTIKVNNAPGTMDQIKVGMQVRDLVEADDQTLDSLTVSIADPAPAAPTKKKK